MDNIETLNGYKEVWLQKIPHKIIIWIIIVITSLIIFSLLIYFYPYNKIRMYEGLVQKDNQDYYINILVLESDINNITNKILLIDNKKKDYKVIDISSDYYLDNSQKYRQITLKTTIDKNSIINNNILELKFIIGKTTIYQLFKERIKKGMI